MVRHPLQSDQQALEDDPHLDGAFARLQPLDIVLLDILAKGINDFLQRLHMGAALPVALAKAFDGQTADVAHCSGEGRELMPLLLREAQFLVMDFLCGFHDIQRVVGDSLKIAEAVEDHGHGPAVPQGDVPARELHQIGAQYVFVFIHDGFQPDDFLLFDFIIIQQRLQRKDDGLFRYLRHFPDLSPTNFHGEGRIHQESFVDGNRSFPGNLLPDILVVGNGDFRQLDENLGEGKQDHGGADIEQTVDPRDSHGGGAVAKECEINESVEQIKGRHEQDGAEEIEIEVHHGRALRVLAGAYGGNDGGHAGPDILAHDDGNRHGIRNGSRGAECLQDTHGSRGTLNQGREQRAHDHAQNRIAEFYHEGGKGRIVRQAGHGAAHGLHAEHQDREADQDAAHVFFLRLSLAGHDQRDADSRKDRRKGGWLAEPDPKGIPLDPCERKYPRGDGGSNVGAHDDSHRLGQLHDSGVHEAHHHHRGGRRGLDHGRDSRSQQDSKDLPGRQFFQNIFQSSTGCFGKSRSHGTHTIQKQR